MTFDFRSDFGLVSNLKCDKMVGSLLTTLDNSSATGGRLIMAGLFGFAFWLYLIAQIVHIRANTEK
jgi:uncharacterized BrkB/YihY/UPF0761 family membrane protein